MRTLIILALLAICGCKDQSTPKSGGDGKDGSIAKSTNYEEWSHTEMLDFLNQRGFDLIQMESNSEGSFGRPALFVERTSKWAKNKETAEDGRHSKALEVTHVMIYKTSQDAKDQVGKLGSIACAWHRFCFEANPITIKRIKSVLP